jgi:WD40 repeat protein
VVCTELDGAPVAVSGGWDGTARVWNLKTYSCKALPPLADVTSIAVTPRNGIVVGSRRDIAAFRYQNAIST